MGNFSSLKRSNTFGLIIWIFIISACSNRDNSPVLESGNNLVGLASTIYLQPAENRLLILDYFVHPELIDSIEFDAGKVNISTDGLYFEFDDQVTAPLGLLNVYSADTTFSIPVIKSNKIRTSFTLHDPDRQYGKVQIAGDINQWNPQLGEMQYSNGAWERWFWLLPGQYSYRIFRDGKASLDPFNNDSIDNNMGGFNSLKFVKAFSDEYPELATVSFTNNEIILTQTNATDITALWQNQKIAAGQISINNNQISITIPKIAQKMKRSYIRVLAQNQNNISNDLLIPLDYGKVLSSTSELERSDWHANILYFMMVDRFNNGDSTNDHPLNIPEVNPKADYFGGDIKGITDKIESGYFKELGVNSIWLSPIIQNPLGAYGQYPTPKTKFSAYHGYWPISFNKVDFRLGSPADLRELVKVAHEHNLNVLIDLVANHVHQEHPIYKQHPEWATELYLPDGSLNTERWDEYRLTTWFDTFLPTLDLTNPELVDMVTDSAVYWIKEYDIDGFRHDATKHVPEYFWRELTKKLKSEVIIPKKKRVYQIGETYGSRELIASYINSGEMDAQFDFGVYDDALASFAREDVPFSRLETSLKESFKYYGYHHLMGNISGNQDKPRFMAYAGGDLRFDEDSKLAGWTRDITVTRPEGYEKLKSFIAFNMTIPGIPVIYYGDEYGMTGANDPDNRRQMQFDLTNDDEIEVKSTVARLTGLRTSRLELAYGDFEFLYTSKNVLAFARTYFDKITIVVFNKDSVAQDIQLKVPEQFNNSKLQDLTATLVAINAGYISLSIEPDSFIIITSK